ncbi:MAG: 50S ribosomal protein L18 [Pseudomonadota bacterium]
MTNLTTKRKALGNRQARTRKNLRRTEHGHKRLSVFRSVQHIYAQVIDDANGLTLAQASTLDKELKGKLKSGGNVEAAKAVGALVAARAKKAGVEQVVFDRGGYMYHGRVKALADAARESGLKF